MVGVVVVAILVQGGRAGQQAALKTDIAALGVAALGLAALGLGWVAKSQFQKPRPSLVHSEW